MRPNTQLGPVMLDLCGQSITCEEKDFLQHPATGGVIFFTRNYENPAQIAGLVQAIRRVRPEILIAVDHEGGRVQRFREGFTRLPPAARYADRPSKTERLENLESSGWLMAAELRSVGIDFSFAPVLDVDCGISQIIGDRAFSQEAETVAENANAFALGMRRAGMAAVGKHFPGHGAVSLDSHLALPEDGRPYAEIEAKDLLPFKKLISEGLEGVMPAHVIYRQVDDMPAGFSAIWIKEILRKKLAFNGAVFSDDLSMEGAAIFAGAYPDRARLAIEAGCDMVLVCNKPEIVGFVLESLESLDWKDHQPRLAALSGKFPIDRPALFVSDEWRKAEVFIQQLNEERLG